MQLLDIRQLIYNLLKWRKIEMKDFNLEGRTAAITGASLICNGGMLA